MCGFRGLAAFYGWNHLSLWNNPKLLCRRLKKKKNNPPCLPPFPLLLPPFAQRRARAKTDTLLKHQRASMSGPVRYGRVVGPYDAEGDPSGLAVGPGEVVEVMREVMDRAGMLFVVLDGEAGFVPEACVEILPEDFAPDDDGDGGDGKKKKKKKKSKWSFTLFKKKKVPLRGLGFLCCWWCVWGFCFVSFDFGFSFVCDHGSSKLRVCVPIRLA